MKGIRTVISLSEAVISLSEAFLLAKAANIRQLLLGGFFMATNRSRRLRKKLCVDEFQELGFELQLSYPEVLKMQLLKHFLLI